MKYNYQSFPLSKIDPVTGLDHSWRPALRVVLWHNHKRTPPLLSVLDTGADHCIFDSEVGLQLGIPVTKGPSVEISGIGGGPITGFLHQLTMTVAASNYQAPIVFAYNIPATGILGQVGFFDHFIVTFDWTPQPPSFEIRSIPRN